MTDDFKLNENPAYADAVKITLEYLANRLKHHNDSTNERIANMIKDHKSKWNWDNSDYYYWFGAWNPDLTHRIREILGDQDNEDLPF